MKQIYILMDNDGILAAYNHKYIAEREAKFRKEQEEKLHIRYGGLVISQKHYFHVETVSLLEGE